MSDAIPESEIWKRLTEIFHEVFMRDNITLSPHLTARDVDGWDSFKQVEIIIASQEAFGIRFTTREIDSLKEVGDLVRIVSTRAASKLS